MPRTWNISRWSLASLRHVVMAKESASVLLHASGCWLEYGGQYFATNLGEYYWLSQTHTEGEDKNFPCAEFLGNFSDAVTVKSYYSAHT